MKYKPKWEKEVNFQVILGQDSIITSHFSKIILHPCWLVDIMDRFLSDAEVSERKYWTKPLRDTYGLSMERLIE